MSEDGIENLYMVGHRRPRQEDALQLGPRKKPFVLSRDRSSCSYFINIGQHVHHLVVSLILLYIMGGTLVGRCTRCVVSVL